MIESKYPVLMFYSGMDKRGYFKITPRVEKMTNLPGIGLEARFSSNFVENHSFLWGNHYFSPSPTNICYYVLNNTYLSKDKPNYTIYRLSDSHLEDSRDTEVVAPSSSTGEIEITNFFI